MKRFAARPFLMLLLASTGCFGEFDWQTVIDDVDSPSGICFAWRNEDELWVFGDAVHRRADGDWARVDVCGPHGLKADSKPKSTTTLAFEGELVWALCGAHETEGQVLVQWDAELKGVVALPVDGPLSLVPLVSGGVMLRGSTSLWGREGAEWKAVAALPPMPAGSAISDVAGVSPVEVYLTGNVGGSAAAFAWNNGVWSQLPTPLEARLEVRDGALWSLGTKLSGGVAQPPVFAAAVEIEGRPLHLVAFVPPATGIFTANSTGPLLLWRADLDDGSATFMGSAPNGDLIAYAIDGGTFLLHSSDGIPTAGGSGFHFFLKENR